MNDGLLIVLSSPSGGGKGTIVSRLLNELDSIKLSVSATTRLPRPGEKDGVHYFFIEKKEFEDMIEAGEVLEYAEYCDNYYGTPQKPVEEWTKVGTDVILEIEVAGGAQIKEKMPNSVSIFILPPTMQVLESRLRNRGTESDEMINKRLEAAKTEIQHAKDYDYVVFNDKLEDAIEEVKTIIKAEKLKFSRNKNSIERVLNNA